MTNLQPGTYTATISVNLGLAAPLAIPVMLDIGRERVGSEADEDLLLEETETLIAEAEGRLAPSTEELVVSPSVAADFRMLSRTRDPVSPRRRPRPFRGPR